jgi:hypothetical protein
MQLAAAVSRKSRGAKIKWARNHIEAGATVLLVGASVPHAHDLGIDNIVERGIGEFADIHALVYDSGDPQLGCPFTRGDACDLPFPDRSFDYVFSNAVIEHVGGPDRARTMLDESKRVARKGAFHTTPDRWFPIETHTQIPLLHWLPSRFQQRAFAKAGKPYWSPSSHWLFGRRSLLRLSPDFSVERLSPLALIAVWHG